MATAMTVMYTAPVVAAFRLMDLPTEILLTILKMFFVKVVPQAVFWAKYGQSDGRFSLSAHALLVCRLWYEYGKTVRFESPIHLKASSLKMFKRLAGTSPYHISEPHLLKFKNFEIDVKFINKSRFLQLSRWRGLHSVHIYMHLLDLSGERQPAPASDPHGFDSLRIGGRAMLAKPEIGIQWIHRDHLTGVKFLFTVRQTLWDNMGSPKQRRYGERSATFELIRSSETSEQLARRFAMGDPLAGIKLVVKDQLSREFEEGYPRDEKVLFSGPDGSWM